MELYVVAMGMLMVGALGYLIAEPISLWHKSHISAADLLIAPWKPKHETWNASIITGLRQMWPCCEILTNVPADTLVTGPKAENLKTMFARRPVDLVIVNQERKIEAIYLLAVKGESDRKHASHLRTILGQAGYQASLIDHEKLKALQANIHD